MDLTELKDGIKISMPQEFKLSELKEYIKSDGLPVPIRSAEIIDFSFKVVDGFIEVIPYF